MQRNIFILPTGAGVVFAFLLFIMLLTGINYQNSLIYLLTFLLGALFVAAMHQTHNNLVGLELTLIRAGEGFAGENIPFTVRANSANRDAAAIAFSNGSASLEYRDVSAGESVDVVVHVNSTSRGYLGLERLRIGTRFPFGLLEAWSWMRPAAHGVVYPRPIMPPAIGFPGDQGDESSASLVDEGHDHADVRPWRMGDLTQRVLWKRFARTGEMVIADWQGEQGSTQWIDYAMFPGVDQELRLSYLAALVLERVRLGQVYGLRLPGVVIDPDEGAYHQARCLRALAVFGKDAPDSGKPPQTNDRETA
ncbi:DUF58 domain-containing protein [Marinobacter caseinilyticus]|uniref:DUF58 domain-containing protein n=1 Tax=Marinobacter caseinilyticus TaxID=2692195 RepID=UPI001F1BB9C1|nr:DUF58 domain-containing protein [Marinobacter caseinilyticus]